MMAMLETFSRVLKWMSVALVLLLLIVVVDRRMPGSPLNVQSDPDLRNHYLLDYEYMVDPDTGAATMGHLVVLNPGGSDASLTLTAYFENREPERFQMTAPAYASTESNYTSWPVESGERFALQVESSAPVFCQATIGWNNTSNDYEYDATSGSEHRRREAAKSYRSIPALAKQWFVADGFIIDKPGRTWLSESEWLILLNPNDQELAVSLTTYSRGVEQETALTVPAQRLRWIHMNDIAPRNRHYGARLTSSADFAAQWVRAIYWNDSTELMTYWSVPLVPMESASD